MVSASLADMSFQLATSSTHQLLLSHGLSVPLLPLRDRQTIILDFALARSRRLLVCLFAGEISLVAACKGARERVEKVDSSEGPRSLGLNMARAQHRRRLTGHAALLNQVVSKRTM